MARISDLIQDSRLETAFLPDCTVHTFQESDPKSKQRIVTRSEHWRRQKIIACGAFGTVWLETCTHSGGTRQNATVRAVKQIDLDSRFGEIDYHRELEAIAKFSHARYERCFVKSLGWYEGPSQLFIAMEYLEIGDLSMYLDQNPPLPETEARNIAYQILDGLSMMHQNGFAHRDLKPNNILIKSHPPHEWWIKLADFGITKRIEEGRDQSPTRKGTPRYFAPEIWGFVTGGSAFATDIWALGAIVFEILTKKTAFGNPASLASYKGPEQFPTNLLTDMNVTQSGIDFVISLMHPDPKHRITTTKAMSDLWIRSLIPCSSESTKSSHGEPQFFSPSVDSLVGEFASWNTPPPPDTQDPIYVTPLPNRLDTTKVIPKPVTVAEKERKTSSLENTRPSSTLKSRDDFEVAIICALPLEADAMISLFDHHWDNDLPLWERDPNDPNFYTLGTIGSRNVVLVHLPGMGKAMSAAVAACCAMTFKNVKLALVVGICGGVPVKKNREEILLGDVLISKGVVQYDLGRQFPDGFKRKINIENLLGRPNVRISSLLAKLETRVHRNRLEEQIARFLADSDGLELYPGEDEDRLFLSNYEHKHHNPQDCSVCTSCTRDTNTICDTARASACEDLGCSQSYLVQRRRRNQQNKPVVHIGLFASGDSVVKSAVHRDSISKEVGVIAFEMEGAGAWDAIPCVIIKGACDYADSHKNKLWQMYAAATAAACAKAFVHQW